MAWWKKKEEVPEHTFVEDDKHNLIINPDQTICIGIRSIKHFPFNDGFWYFNTTLRDDDIEFIDYKHLKYKYSTTSPCPNQSDYIISKRIEQYLKTDYIINLEFVGSNVFEEQDRTTLKSEYVNPFENSCEEEYLKMLKRHGKGSAENCLESGLIETKEEIDDYCNGELSYEDWNNRKVYRTFSGLGFGNEKIRIIQKKINQDISKYRYAVALYKECKTKEEFMYLLVEGM